MRKAQKTLKILITGSDGFIGSNLMRFFANNNKEKGIKRQIPASVEYDPEGDRLYDVFGTVFSRSPQYNECYIDVQNPDTLSNLWDEDFDIVIHTIGLMDQNAPREKMFGINAEGTRLFLEWAKKHGVKHFIYTSSIAVYGIYSIGQERNENDVLTGITPLPYGRSKYKGEQYVRKSSIPYTIIRLPPVLGENDTYLTPSIFPRIIDNTLFTCNKSYKKKPKISFTPIEWIPGVIERIINNGPSNDFFNSCAVTIPWDDFIKEYIEVFKETIGNAKISEELSENMINRISSSFRNGIEIKKRHILSVLGHLNDKHYLLIATFSKFGSSFSHEKINRYFPDLCKSLYTMYDWRNSLKKAVIAAVLNLQ